MNNRQEHWEKVYADKQPHEVSWTQDIPRTSLHLIRGFNLPKSAAIIDVGGGDSKLVDYLLEEGFEDITVLDISENALERAKKRLGDRATKVKWIASDVTVFRPDRIYDLWHDRATFHFLTDENDIQKYLSLVNRSVKKYMVLGTFSETGPDKCSALPVRKYSESIMSKYFENYFSKIKCFTEDHVTPFNTKQNFLFCSFQKINN